MKLSDLANKMIRTICILLFVLIVAAAIYYRSLSFLPFAFGVLLGSAVSIVKVIILERAVNKAVDMDKKAAGSYVQIQHFLRLLLSGGVLLLAAVVPGIDLWGAAAGILTFQASIYILNFFSKP